MAKRPTAAERLAKRKKEIAELEKLAEEEKMNEARKQESGPSIREFDAMGRNARAIERTMRLLANGNLPQGILSGIDVVNVNLHLKVARDRLVKRWHDGMAKRKYFLKRYPSADDGKSPKKLGIAAPKEK